MPETLNAEAWNGANDGGESVAHRPDTKRQHCLPKSKHNTRIRSTTAQIAGYAAPTHPPTSNNGQAA